MGQFAGYVQGSKRPRRCEVKRQRMHDGGGKSHNRRKAWFEVTQMNLDWQLRNVKVSK